MVKKEMYQERKVEILMDSTRQHRYLYEATGESAIKKIILKTELDVRFIESMTDDGFNIQVAKIPFSGILAENAKFELKIKEDESTIQISFYELYQKNSLNDNFVILISLSNKFCLDSLTIETYKDIRVNFNGYISQLSLESKFGNIDVKSSFKEGYFKTLSGKIYIDNFYKKDNQIYVFSISENITIHVNTKVVKTILKSILGLARVVDTTSHRKYSSYKTNKSVSTIYIESLSSAVSIKN